MIIMRPLATALLLLAAPLLGLAQSIGGLTARATATSIALRPTSLEGAALEDLQFSYSQDAGATWKSIEASCLEFDSGEAIWHVLECLQVDVFEGSNIQFKASVSSCNPVSFDGYTYKVVLIGSQCWFAENLRSKNYANGDPIQSVQNLWKWASLKSGARTFYDKSRVNLSTYGGLYNWFAVNDARGLCPSGWHVPTDEEYMILELELGMSSSSLDDTGLHRRGTDQGDKMKSSDSGLSSWNGNNMSGFSALPGGFLYEGGAFLEVGVSAYFWSSSPSGSGARARKLYSGNGHVYRETYSQRSGFSVRCIQD